MILDPLIGSIEADAAIKEFTPVLSPKFSPTGLAKPEQAK